MSKELNPYTKQKNSQEIVKVQEADIIELPETRAIRPVKEFAMPLATVEQVRLVSDQYQGFLNALLKESDIQEIETKDPRTGEKIIKLSAKKSGFGKIARFWGISTEILRSFEEDQICKKTVWGFSNGKSFPKQKEGDHFTVAKAWAKAILPNGQFAVRGAACSEAERKFAHLTHDLLATAETRATKRAIEAVIGMGEIELMEDEGLDGENGENRTPKEKAAKKIKVVPKKKKAEKPKKKSTPSNEEDAPSPSPAPESSASDKQIEYIGVAMDKIGFLQAHTYFRIPDAKGVPHKKTIEELTYQDARFIISHIDQGKEAFTGIMEWVD